VNQRLVLAFLVVCIIVSPITTRSTKAAAIAEIGTNFVRISAGEGFILPGPRQVFNVLRLNIVSVETTINSKTSGDGVIVDRSSLTSGNTFIESAISASAKATGGEAQIDMRRKLTFSVENIGPETIDAASLYFEVSSILPFGSMFFPISRWATPPADSLMPPQASLGTPVAFDRPPLALVFDTGRGAARAETSTFFPNNENRFPASGATRWCSTTATSYPDDPGMMNYAILSNGSACGVGTPDTSFEMVTFRAELDPGESFLASFSLGIRLEVSAEPIPEPASLSLAVIGFATLGVAATTRRRRFALTEKAPAS
jgi:hypothetical protein